MASLIGNCLARLVAAKRITQGAADAALALHQGIQGRLGAEMSPGRADAAAALEAARAMAQAARERKLQLAQDAIRMSEVEQRMAAHPKGPASGLISTLVPDPWGAQRGLNVESHSEWVLGELLKRAGAALDPYRSRLAGFRQDLQGIRNVVRELFGDATGDPKAAGGAAGWTAGVDYGVARVKKAGKPLHVLEDWRLPQDWNRTQIKNAGPGFLDDVLRASESGGVTVMDRTTGAAADSLKVPAIVGAMQESVIAGRGASMGGGHGFDPRMRVLRFNNAETWLRFNDKYGAGRGGIYAAMVSHFRGMAREIALAEVLGPSHRAIFATHLENAKVAEAKHGQTVSGPNPTRMMSSPTAADRTYKMLTGVLSSPQNETIAGIFGAMRNIKTSASLGTASASAIPGDAVTMAWAANANGLPAVQIIAKSLALMVSDSPRKRAMAARLGLVAHGLVDSLQTASRFEDRIVGRNWPAWMASAALRINGLVPWTNGAKRVTSMEWLGAIAEQSEHAFADVDPRFRGFLEKHGFTAAEWDEIRVVPQLEEDGARFFDAEAAGKLGDRMMSAVIDERHFFVVEPTALTQAITTGGLQRGTIPGEMIRSAWMFKNFSMSILMTHVTRTLTTGPYWSRPFKLAGFVVAMTLAGAVSMQAKALLTGRDPRDMRMGSFWWAAALQGGGAGIFGDYINSAVNRGGQGIMSTAVGPLLGEVGGTADLLLAGLRDLFGDGPPRNGKAFGEHLAQYMKRWTPFSTNWFTRAATDRYIFDFIQSMIDPNYPRSLDRQEQRIRRETGQQFWWRPGDAAPDRPPDLGAALGAR